MPEILFLKSEEVFCESKNKCYGNLEICQQTNMEIYSTVKTGKRQPACLLAEITYEVTPGWAVHWSDVGLCKHICQICFIFDPSGKYGNRYGSNMCPHKRGKICTYI